MTLTGANRGKVEKRDAEIHRDRETERRRDTETDWLAAQTPLLSQTIEKANCPIILIENARRAVLVKPAGEAII